MVAAAEASTTWRAIKYGLELLRCGTIYRVGDGESVRIWRDNWIPRLPSLKPSRSRGICRLRHISQLIREGTNDWDEAQVRQIFQPWDVEEILKIKPDSIAWYYEKFRVFLVRSAYRLALSRALNLEEEGSSLTPKGEKAVWKRLWNLPIPPKVRNFLWKMVKNGLPTNDN
jgi:hypothetical protein